MDRLQNIDWIEVAIFAIPVIIAITLHEAAHGFVSLRCGDDTALRAGRVTLNPLKHIDPFGTILLPLALYIWSGFVFGYAKPVSVNFAALRHPKRDMILVAGAGPGMNLLLAAISGGLIYVFVAAGGGAEWLGKMLFISILMNFALAVFNMLPVPPLDGSRVLAGLLPNALAVPYLRLGAIGFLVLIGLVILLPLIGRELGFNFDIFETLVWKPAWFLTSEFLQRLGIHPPAM